MLSRLAGKSEKFTSLRCHYYISYELLIDAFLLTVRLYDIDTEPQHDKIENEIIYM